MCASLTALFFILYEVGLTLLYNWIKKETPEMTTWLILGSKPVKLVIAVMILLLVRFVTSESVVRFGIFLLVILLLSVVYESVYFIRRGKKNNK